MQSFGSQVKTKQILEVNPADRWQVYQRLQELEIPCWCGINQPLEVQVKDAIAAMQLWSVMRQFTASRHDLIGTLEKCWQHNY